MRQRGGEDAPVSVVAGLAAFPGHGTTVGALIGRARAAATAARGRRAGAIGLPPDDAPGGTDVVVEDRRAQGVFETAHGGTLFLDEIGEISPGMQTKLLRVLEQRRFTRVGGTEEIEVDVRVVCATNRDLEAETRRNTLPDGPVLPDQRVHDPGPAAARSPRRDRATRGAVPPPGQRPPAGAGVDARRRGRPPALSVAGQRARAPQRDGARRGRPHGGDDHRTTSSSIEVTTADRDDLTAPVVAEALLAQLASSFGVTLGQTRGVLLARVVDATGQPRSGIAAASFVIDGTGSRGPYFLNGAMAAAPTATTTSASGWVVYFEVAPGLVGLRAAPSANVTFDMPVSPVEAGVVTVASVRVVDGAFQPPKNVSFSKQVFPIFAKRGCVACHAQGNGPGRELGGLTLNNDLNSVYRELTVERPGRVVVAGPGDQHAAHLPIAGESAGPAPQRDVHELVRS